MKKYLTTILLIIPLFLSAQRNDPLCGKNQMGIGKLVDNSFDYKKNALYGTLQSSDVAFGVTYMRRYSSHVASDLFFSKGKYWMPYIKGLIPHYKFGVSMDYFTPKWGNITNFFSIGFSYHYFGWADTLQKGQININALEDYFLLNHYSFEIGAGMNFGKWPTAFFKFDFIRNEGLFGIGFTF